jgi:hypothetical protein
MTTPMAKVTVSAGPETPEAGSIAVRAGVCALLLEVLLLSCP